LPELDHSRKRPRYSPSPPERQKTGQAKATPGTTFAVILSALTLPPLLSCHPFRFLLKRPARAANQQAPHCVCRKHELWMMGDIAPPSGRTGATSQENTATRSLGGGGLFVWRSPHKSSIEPPILHRHMPAVFRKTWAAAANFRGNQLQKSALSFCLLFFSPSVAATRPA